MSATKGIKKFCDKCQSNIGTYSFKRHYKSCDGSGLRKLKYGSNDSFYKCQFCEKSFKPRGMQNHIRIVHEGRTNSIITGKPTWNKGLVSADFSLNGKGNHKGVLLKERGHKCEKCNNTEWLGKPITIQLEHKDGNHFNNEKENLQLLCPNCHSQTETFNRRKPKNRISDEQLLYELKKCDNIYQCLCKLGLNSSSTNYSRANRLLNN